MMESRVQANSTNLGNLKNQDNSTGDVVEVTNALLVEDNLDFSRNQPSHPQTNNLVEPTDSTFFDDVAEATTQNLVTSKTTTVLPTNLPIDSDNESSGQDPQILSDIDLFDSWGLNLTSSNLKTAKKIDGRNQQSQPKLKQHHEHDDDELGQGNILGSISGEEDADTKATIVEIIIVAVLFCFILVVIQKWRNRYKHRRRDTKRVKNVVSNINRQTGNKTSPDGSPNQPSAVNWSQHLGNDVMDEHGMLIGKNKSHKNKLKKLRKKLSFTKYNEDDEDNQCLELDENGNPITKEQKDYRGIPDAFRPDFSGVGSEIDERFTQSTAMGTLDKSIVVSDKSSRKDDVFIYEEEPQEQAPPPIIHINDDSQLARRSPNWSRGPTESRSETNNGENLIKVTDPLIIEKQQDPDLEFKIHNTEMKTENIEDQNICPDSWDKQIQLSNSETTNTLKGTVSFNSRVETCEVTENSVASIGEVLSADNASLPWSQSTRASEKTMPGTAESSRCSFRETVLPETASEQQSEVQVEIEPEQQDPVPYAPEITVVDIPQQPIPEEPYSTDSIRKFTEEMEKLEEEILIEQEKRQEEILEIEEQIEAIQKQETSELSSVSVSPAPESITSQLLNEDSINIDGAESTAEVETLKTSSDSSVSSVSSVKDSSPSSFSSSDKEEEPSAPVTNQKLDLAKIQADAEKAKKQQEKEEEPQIDISLLARRGTIGINSTAGMFG